MKMKKFYAYMTAETGERFAWEDGQENTVIVTADTAEDAAEIFRGAVDSDYAEELEEYMPPVEIQDFEEWAEYHPYYTEWK